MKWSNWADHENTWESASTLTENGFKNKVTELEVAVKARPKISKRKDIWSIWSRRREGSLPQSAFQESMVTCVGALGALSSHHHSQVVVPAEDMVRCPYCFQVSTQSPVLLLSWVCVRRTTTPVCDTIRVCMARSLPSHTLSAADTICFSQVPCMCINEACQKK